MTRLFLRSRARNLLHRHHHRNKMNNAIAILCLLFMLVESFCNMKTTDAEIYKYVHGAYYMITFILILFLLIDKRRRDSDKSRRPVYFWTIVFLILLNTWIVIYEFTTKSLQEFLDKNNSPFWNSVFLIVIVISIILILLGYGRKNK